MCASNADHTAIEIVRPPAGSKVGERVTLEGNPIGDAFSQEWQKQLNPKKKIMEAKPIIIEKKQGKLLKKNME